MDEEKYKQVIYRIKYEHWAPGCQRTYISYNDYGILKAMVKYNEQDVLRRIREYFKKLDWDVCDKIFVVAVRSGQIANALEMVKYYRPNGKNIIYLFKTIIKEDLRDTFIHAVRQFHNYWNDYWNEHKIVTDKMFDYALKKERTVICSLMLQFMK